MVLFMEEQSLQFFASGSKKMTEGFGPKVPGFDHINLETQNPDFQI